MKTTLLRSLKLATVVAMLAAGLYPVFHSPAFAADTNPDTPAIAPPTPGTNDPPSIAAPPAPPAPPVKLSAAATEITRLAETGTAESVMQAFIANSTSLFTLGSEQIIYLNDLGVPSSVITAMIQHDISVKAGTVEDAPPPPADALPPGIDSQFPPASVATPISFAAPSTNYFGYTNYGPGIYGETANYIPPDDDANLFYDSLAPYGTWQDVAGLGLCWQPTVVVMNPDWRPYCDRGRWLNSDHGWCWQSDYSWGWAAFHYGRWRFDEGRGWIWRPGRDWAPAWVLWRQSPEYCGWAPLPPHARFVPEVGFRFGNRAVNPGFEFGLSERHYVYIPIERLVDYAPDRYRLPYWRIGEAHAESTVIPPINFENHRVIHNGVDPRYVAEVAHADVRKVVIHEMAAGNGANSRFERLEKSGDKLVFFRPHLPAYAGPTSGRQVNGPHSTPAGALPAKPIAALPTVPTSSLVQATPDSASPKHQPLSPTLTKSNRTLESSPAIHSPATDNGDIAAVDLSHTRNGKPFAAIPVGSAPATSPAIAVSSASNPAQSSAHSADAERIRRLPNMNLSDKDPLRVADRNLTTTPGGQAGSANGAQPASRFSSGGGWQQFQSEKASGDPASFARGGVRDPMAPIPPLLPQTSTLHPPGIPTPGYGNTPYPAVGFAQPHHQPNEDLGSFRGVPSAYAAPAGHPPSVETHQAAAHQSTPAFSAPAHHDPPPAAAPAPHVSAPAPAPAPDHNPPATATHK